MGPVIGRRWRPTCGFAEPYASEPGRNPGKLTGESSPFYAGARRRCGPAGSGRLQLALWAGFTCVPEGFGQLARWPNHLKGRREGFQNRRPSSDTEVAGIRRGISSCAGGASCRRRRLRFGSLFGLFNGQHLAEGGLLFRQFPTVIGEQCLTDHAAVVSKPQPPQHELRETVPRVKITYPYRAGRYSSNSRDWLGPKKPDIIILPSEHHPNSALLEAGSQNLERNPRRFHGGLRSNGARNRMLGYPSHKVRSVPDFVGPFEEVGCGPPPNRCV